MPGTSKGALKAAETNKKRYGKDFYRIIGRMGGKVKVAKGFDKNRELARIAGRRGGLAERNNG